MILFSTGWYTLELCQRYPILTFVYGDNSLGFGKGGQAVIRDEPNALGVPTKWAPTDDEPAFYSETCFDSTLIEARIDTIGRMLAGGHTVVIPGTYYDIQLGTGLSQLPTRAPAVYQTICEQIQMMADHFGISTEVLV